ncbi:hypothetical protein Phi10:1_gp097 [Cellulophaga phage phi10:1]|uniref:Uncharacterized protein n=1 Tax=Cellulophaga phage phi10:1 TaxID=1327981 RepID=S0A1S6_9CAUD|nr:hypothetical protein Phi10:1_gp097 [Cellulophaga phage phi10:1]AGO48437.1 hypothetical protein Phi10:1_gp097 [Cellulophaga phage phi10:1]
MKKDKSELAKQSIQTNQHIQKIRIKTIKLILSITALLLFVFNSDICEAVHGDNIEMWWKLRIKLFSLIFLLLSLIGFLESKMWLRVILTQVVIFTSSDAIDRWLFNITNFVDSDYILIFFSLVVFIKQSVKCLKKGEKVGY